MTELDGKTILRFAHAYESGGGTERYLEDLDRALLERNAMTVVRMHLTRRSDNLEPTEIMIGRGRLITVPLPVIPSTRDVSTASDTPSWRHTLKSWVRNWVLYNPLIWRVHTKRRLQSRRLPPQAGQAQAAGAATARLLKLYRIDLAVMHFFGGADADEVIVACRDKGIPITLINHYSNDRFLHLAMRKHAQMADGIGGVNGLQLPAYMRHRFCNLSDGVDTDFFRREHARRLPALPADPAILLPARVTKEKGQLDLVRAVAQLRQEGIACCAVFAGRVDSSGFVEELKREITRHQLEPHVHFVGALGMEDLRDWYAASAVVAFPTYHHEGLGRVLIEAAAMCTPVVAYGTGGVPDAIRHGEDGYVVATGDFTDLVRRLRELLQSPKLRGRLGLKGRMRAESEFSLAALAERHERYYLQCFSPKRKGQPASCP